MSTSDKIRLRNKKTGKVKEFDVLGCFMLSDDYPNLYTEDKTYNSLAELNEEWEDCKGPLIENEKVRKVVRAWAKINNFTKVKLLVSPEYGSQFEGGYGFSRITFSDITLEYLDYPKEYTITELCGEEEE